MFKFRSIFDSCTAHGKNKIQVTDTNGSGMLYAKMFLLGHKGNNIKTTAKKFEKRWDG